MKSLLKIFVLLFLPAALISCNLGCLLGSSCLFASGATTNVKENRYYEKKFLKMDTTLSTIFIYGIVEKTDDYKNSENYKEYLFKENWYLFYDNGLVLKESYFTKSIKKDTIHTYTESLKYACCHSWTIGSYKISNDTLKFGVKAGYQKDWTYYKAKIYSDKIIFFEEEKAGVIKVIDFIYPKVFDRVVKRDIRLKSRK
jgi:hypothetical protein